eukprot:g1038.t1
MDTWSETFREEDTWAAYQSVNEQFADVIRGVYEEGDLIWVHGHPLFLVPYLLRQTLPEAAMGFFLHLPFPSSEIYRILPSRMDILRGLLSCDLLGFNTYDHARHFLSVCTRLLGVECTPREVSVHGHVTSLSICPVGTDIKRIRQAIQGADVQQRRHALSQHFEGLKVLLGVDRLDGTSGLMHKLLAFEELMTNEPRLRHKVVMVQVAEPYSRAVGRSAVEHDELQARINAMVARINSKFGRVGSPGPIYYFARSLGYDDIYAMFSIADVLVCTPTRDGMTLKPYEYVVAKHASHQFATVVLSEFAGCATSLGGAMLVNPWDTAALTKVLNLSINMDQKARSRRHFQMYHCVSTFTLGRWIQTFLTQLGSAAEAAEAPAYLQRLELNPRNASWLRAILSSPNNVVVIISTRTKDVLAEWLRLSLLGSKRSDETDHVARDAAENGYHIQWAGEPWQCMFPDADVSSWRKDVVPLMEYYAERTPGSFIEHRDSSVAWHYLDADPEQGHIQAAELQSALGAMVKTNPVTAHRNLEGKVIEVRPVAVSKVSVLEYALTNMPADLAVEAGMGSQGDSESRATITSVDGPAKFDFILCILSGDDRTDGAVFDRLAVTTATAEDAESEARKSGAATELAVAPAEHGDVPLDVYTCTVGAKVTQSSYYVPAEESLWALLQTLAESSSGSTDEEHAQLL